MKQNKTAFIFMIPIIGGGVFILLYMIATLFYPGGSNLHPNEIGFNWLTNFWCDLTGSIAKNGQKNNAQPIALVAMLVLCLSLSVFWLAVPKLFNSNSFIYKSISYAGIGAMIAACFIFTDFHDFMMNIGSCLGVIALSFTLLGLFRFQYYRLFWSGVGCIFIIGINNLIYYTHYFIDYLPVIQKVSFVFVLFWVGAYCAEGLKKRT